MKTLDVKLSFITIAISQNGIFFEVGQTTKSVLDEITSTCKVIVSDKVILFVSDGNPTDRDTAEETKEEKILRVISDQNALLNNTVTIHTFGVGKGRDVYSGKGHSTQIS